MARPKVRFAVTDGNGRRAASWKLWTQASQYGPEVYLTCRELRGALKTSFHPTGEWHTRMSIEAKARLDHDSSMKPMPKYVEEWDRPSEIAPGFTLAYKILTPWSSPITPMTAQSKRLLEISNAQDGCANETMVLIVSPGKWEVKGVAEIWSAPLSDGGTLVLVNKEIQMPDMPPPRTVQPRFALGKSLSDLNSEGLRMLAATTDHNGHRTFIDAPALYQQDKT